VQSDFDEHVQAMAEDAAVVDEAQRKIEEYFVIKDGDLHKAPEARAKL
jgi:propionyl-CoA synthetase